MHLLRLFLLAKTVAFIVGEPLQGKPDYLIRYE